jgi:hypothetical protein
VKLEREKRTIIAACASKPIFRFQLALTTVHYNTKLDLIEKSFNRNLIIHFVTSLQLLIDAFRCDLLNYEVFFDDSRFTQQHDSHIENRIFGV